MHHIIDFILITRNLARRLVSESDLDIERKQGAINWNTCITGPQRLCKEERTLPRALEEEAHHKDLQSGHGDHHQALDHTEVENPTLGTADSAKVAILACAEVLLVTGDGR